MALCKGMVKLAANSGMCFTKKIDYRKFSQRNRACLVDTLELVRGLEAQGVPSKQAETITVAITKVINDSLENMAHSFVSKAEIMQKTEMAQEWNLFKSEVQSLQEQHLSMLQRQTEKHGSDIDKIHIELRNIRVELTNQEAETAKLVNALYRKIPMLRVQVEAAKSDAINSKLGSVVSVSLVGLAIILQYL